MLILRFRWVDCQLDSLGNCLTPTATKVALYSLPKSLDQTYDRILQSIPDEYRRQAQTALQWLAYSARPLRLSELAEAVAVEPECGWDFLDNRLFDRQKILTICSSLVTVSDGVLTVFPKPSPFEVPLPFEILSEDDEVYSEGAYTVSSETPNDCEIRLAHYSVKEYLASERILQGPCSFFATLDTAAQVLISKTCLTYLSLFDKPDSLPRERCYEEFPLLVYAAEYWHKHAQAAGEEDGIDKLVVHFLDGRESFSLFNWLRIPGPASYPLSHIWHKAKGHLFTSGRALSYACEFGLLKSATRLIEGAADINDPGWLIDFALPAAAGQEHKPLEVVQLLLDAGADVNVKDYYYGTPLYAAARQGHSDTVKLLLNAKADVNAKDLHLRTALHAAVFQGNSEIVKLLLNAGADVHVRGGHYGTALQDAAHFGGIEIVRLLIDAGADVNAQGGSLGNALQIAADRGYRDKFELLLQHGAVITQAGSFASPWDAAKFGAKTAFERSMWKQLSLGLRRH